MMNDPVPVRCLPFTWYIRLLLQIGQNPISPEAATNFLLFIQQTESTGLTKLDLTVTDQMVHLKTELS